MAESKNTQEPGKEVRGDQQLDEEQNGNRGVNPEDHSAEEAAASTTHAEAHPEIKADAATVFRVALRALNTSGVTYAVGAAFARHAYTGIWRPTKDLDVFLKSEELKTALEALTQAGFETEVEEKHWLAKARCEPYFIDLIFGTGHGQIPMDEDFFEGSQKARVVGIETHLIPVEELIVSAMYIAERRRFDGSDVVHLIKASEGELDWQRILNRLGDNRELLLWHLILFDFIYPGHSDYLPKDLMVELFYEVRRRWSKEEKENAFRGTLLDPFSYAVDIEDWDYEDRRKIESLVDEEGDRL